MYVYIYIYIYIFIYIYILWILFKSLTDLGISLDLWIKYYVMLMGYEL